MITSYDAPDGDFPDEDGCVRMNCPLAGFHCIPDKNDPNKCSVTMVIEASLNGFIPGYVQKVVINDSANGMQMIKKLMTKYVDKNQEIINTKVIEQQNDLANYE